MRGTSPTVGEGSINAPTEPSLTETFTQSSLTRRKHTASSIAAFKGRAKFSRRYGDESDSKSLNFLQAQLCRLDLRRCGNFIANDFKFVS
jgi:hypothetical protein